MTADEFWRAVGETLLVQRTRRGWNAVDVERHGGPTYKTVQANELGHIGTVDKLSKHAEALGLGIVDVFRAVLDQHLRPVSPETLQLIRKYEMTTVEGRQALLNVARALPLAAAVVPPDKSE